MPYSILNYLNVRQAYAPTVRSDGKKLAFLTNISGMPQVWQTDLIGSDLDPSWPEQLSFSKDRVMDAAFSPAQGDGRLLYAYDMGGNENAQLFLLGENGEIPLTNGHESALHIFGAWSPDGSQILFSANRRHPGLFDLFLMPIGGKAQMIWQNETPGFLAWQAFSPDGKHATFCLMRSSTDCQLFHANLSTGATILLSNWTEPAFVGDPCFNQNGSSIYAITDYESDFTYINRFDIENQTSEQMALFDWDAQYLCISPDRKWLGYTVNRDGYNIPEVLNTESGEIRRAFEIDEFSGAAAYFDRKMVFTPDSRQLLFSYTTSIQTADVYCWDFSSAASGKVWPLTRSSHGGLPQPSFRTYQLVHYPSLDGLSIPAWYCEPSDEFERPFPVVVIVHGGPEGQSQPVFNFLSQFLLAKGYALLLPNVRGSAGYGKAYGHLDDVEKRMDSVADLAHGVHWLKSLESVDSDRIAVYGGSYGGFMVLSAMTTYPELWAAGINLVGISNFVTFLENTSSYRRTHREAEYGSLEDDREFLESISPINHIQNLKSPLMVIHGANDPRVPLSEAEQLVAALRDQGTSVDYLVFEDEGHGLAKLHNKQVAYPAIADFLSKYL